MTRERFDSLLSMATAQTVAVARTMVVEELPIEVRYQLLDERGKPARPEMKKEEFVQHVWAEGRTPEWIDLSVRARGEAFTLVDVYVASKLVEDESACVYAARGQGPLRNQESQFAVGLGVSWKVCSFQPPKKRGQPAATDNSDLRSSCLS